MRSPMWRCGASSAVLATAMFWTASARAQAAPAAVPAEAAPQVESLPAGIEDILVTARKRSEDVQRVPLSVSAVTGASLERRGIANIKELAVSVPSLALIQQSNARASIVQIRGIGSSGLNPGIEPDVGVYFDGVYQKSVAAVLQSNLLDIEAVEVLRGPQGTLYGRNTPVGAIIVRSRAPSAAPEAMVQGGFGDYGNVYAQGYVGGAIAQNLNARLSIFGSRFDGYDRNLTDGERTNGNRQYGGRLRVRWQPSTSLTTDLVAFYTYARSECCVPDNVDPRGAFGIATPGFLTAAAATIGRPYANLTAKDHVVDSAEFPVEFVKNFGASLSSDIDLGGDLTLTSISAYTGTRIDQGSGASTGQPFVVIKSGFTNPIDSLSQELRLSSGANRRFAYQLGAFLFHETTNFDEQRTSVNVNRVFPVAPQVTPGQSDSFAFDQKTLSASAYGQATFTVTDAFRLTGGLRYSYDRKRGSAINAVSANATRNFLASFTPYRAPSLRFAESKVTWLASAQYDVAPTVMAYATASSGWKSGGFNGRIATPGVPLVFGPENTRNYELGVKSTFFQRRLLVNVSGYALNVDGFQDSVLNPLTGIGFIVGNAGSVRARGIESDFQIRPVEQLLITGSATYLSSKFASYSAAPCYTGAVQNGTSPGTCNLNGRRPAYSPEFRASLGAEFTQPITGRLSGFVRGDVAYTDGQFTYSTLDPRSFQNGYALVNGRIGLQGNEERWRVSLWVKNLTDRAYYTSTAALASANFFSAGGTAGVSGALVGWIGAPRTYGGEVSFKF